MGVRRALVGIVVALVGIPIIIGAVLALLWFTGSNVSAESLAHSVARRLDVGSYDHCRRVRDFWRCRMSDQSGSGYLVYDVRTHGRCWRARIKVDNGEGRTRARANGCIGFRDRYRFLDPLGPERSP